MSYAWKETIGRPRPELLPERPLTLQEQAAHDQDPRPGSWAGEPGADTRRLTQEETDTLIRSELAVLASEAERRQVIDLIGNGRCGVLLAPGVAHASRQRGGIDSDPIVRLLAYRAWGDRDQSWMRQGILAGTPVFLTRGGGVAAARANAEAASRVVGLISKIGYTFSKNT